LKSAVNLGSRWFYLNLQGVARGIYQYLAGTWRFIVARFFGVHELPRPDNLVKGSRILRQRKAVVRRDVGHCGLKEGCRDDIGEVGRYSRRDAFEDFLIVANECRGWIRDLRSAIQLPVGYPLERQGIRLPHQGSSGLLQTNVVPCREMAVPH
jgi:hypothetical protein